KVVMMNSKARPVDDVGTVSWESGPQPTDARLVEETKQGNRDAFGILVERYERRLLRVIQRLVHDRDLAEDLAQETFLRVYRRWDQFDPSRRFSPWLFRIAVNLTLDFLRRRKRRRWTLLFTDRSTENWTDPTSPDPRPQQDLEQEVRTVIDN